MLSRWVVRLNVAALGGALLFVPVTVWAQQASGIAGTVKDSSGSVLPGVTVEATSPVLIEKVRSVVTDGQGRYNIVDLRPGAYVVTFTLTGFNTFKRDGVVLTAGFTAAVNADMQVGSLEETITVTGEAPLVDTQNVRQQKTVSDELLAALPTGSKGLMGIAQLIPGMSSGSDLGGGGASSIYGANLTVLSTYHGKGGSKQTYDGMTTNNLAATGSVSYVMNPSTVEETTVQTGGISAESNASGFVLNMVPKEGGNTFSFSTDGTYTNRHLQGENLTDRLLTRGILTPAETLYAYDVNVTVGGPVRRDRLWFFAATRVMSTKNQPPGLFVNKTQGTPLYTPDLDRPAFSKDWLRSQAVRLTWQVSPRNKVNGFADPQYYMTRGQGTNVAPEAQTCWHMWPQGLYQTTWSSPVTSKFLLEAGASLTKNPFPCTPAQVTQTYDFTVKETDVSTTEASTGFVYNAKPTYLYPHDMDRYAQRLSASYVTGSHAFKAGFNLEQHVHNTLTHVNQDVQYTFNRGVPIRITQWATPYLQQPRTKADLGLFAQDQWAIKRLTLNYGLRLDYFNGYTRPENVPAGRFLGARSFDAVHEVPEWTDLNPRLGASYNLFGNNRTALKTSFGRYVGKMAVLVAQRNSPIETSVNQVTRTWNDANGNYVSDCDLRNFGANGECGPISNVNFGKINPRALRYADDLIRGVGNRDYFWDFGAEVQHELGPGVSVTGGYYRNWSDHFPAVSHGIFWDVGVTDNQAWTPADFTPYCITAPLDPVLPGGGGYQVCGLYDVSPAKFGQGDLVVGRASNYDRPDGGKGRSRTSDFFTVSVNARFGEGVVFGGSADAGRTVEDNCYVVDSPEQLLNCRVVTPFKGQTQIKVHGSYPLPGDVVVSGIFRNISGVSYSANYVVSNAQIKPSLGRNLAACGTQVVCTATATVPLIVPQTQFEPRSNVVDLRLSKIFRVGPRARLRANFDLYNVFNNDSILAINSTYGPFWRRNQAIVGGGGLQMARLIQLGGQLNF